MAGSSPFLRLPAEIRNTIYELALSAPKPLHYHKPMKYSDFKCYDGGRPYLYLRAKPGDPPCDPVHENTPAEFNEVKYVNKQIYAETAGLELKYNDITLFVTTHQGCATPAELLIEWLSLMPITKKSWVKTISIKINVYSIPQSVIPEDADTIARLTRLCNDIPGMKVKYHLPLWRIYFPAVHLGLFGGPFFLAAEKICQEIRGNGFKELFYGLQFEPNSVAGQMWRQNYSDDSDQPVRLVDLQAKNLYFPTIPEGAQIPIINK